MTYKVIIDGRLSGLNEYIDACRRNKYEGAKLKKAEQTKCMWQIKAQLKKKLKPPVFITFRWGEPNMKRDLDNICFAKKYILDALVASGRLGNDNWTFVKGFVDEFFVDAKYPRIEVILEEFSENS